MVNKPTFTFRLDPEIRDALERIAEERNQSVGSLLEMIARDWIAANGEVRRSKRKQ